MLGFPAVDESGDEVQAGLDGDDEAGFEGAAQAEGFPAECGAFAQVVGVTYVLLAQVFHVVDVQAHHVAESALEEERVHVMLDRFGYEASHYEVSMQMAEASLLPAVRNKPDAIVVADGTSCRHQIADGAQREAIHVARLLAAQLS